MQFVDNLKELMIENNIDTKTLSNKTGIKLSTLYFYFEYKTLPDIKNAIKLSEFFNCSIDYLLGLTDTIDVNNEHFSDKFIENYNYLLKSKNTTNYKVCNDLKLNRNSIYNWRKGQIPKTVNLIEIAKYFEVSIDFLVGNKS